MIPRSQIPTPAACVRTITQLMRFPAVFVSPRRTVSGEPYLDARRGRAGYVYELAFRQFELSHTRIFDQPPGGRGFFEGVITDHRDLGRPDQVALIFDGKVTSRTPGCSRTKVVTKRDCRLGGAAMS
jgi:hypothetical protein